MQVDDSELEVVQINVARSFDPLPDDMVICPAAVHISIDPVSGERMIAVYTDDGHGNGDHIMSVYFKDNAGI